MKKRILLAAAVILGAQTAAADTVKIGVLLGLTGPIESLTPAMAAAAELAISEASDSGQFLGGTSIEAVRGDSTCVDAAAATAAAEKLVNTDNVAAIMGADCSGVTTAVANQVAVPNGIVMISPSATSPALSTLDDNGLFFRTAPSDARQGQVLAEVVMSRGISSVAISYTNNDYGKGLSDSFQSAYEGLGGEVALSASHEDGKGDYSAEVGALSASGAEHLAVFGYLDQGGKGIIQAALDLGAFEQFILADGMVGQSLIDNFGDSIAGSIATAPGSTSPNAAAFEEIATSAGADQSGPFRRESYDAAALIILAAQAAGSADRAAIQSKILDVANAPGEQIGPGELAKALMILAEGGEVDYQGASNVELDEGGNTFGSYQEFEIRNNMFDVVAQH